jgi:hypothetical protein
VSGVGLGPAIALGALVGLALGVLLSVTTSVPLGPELGLVLGGLVGWLSGGTRGTSQVSQENVERLRRSYVLSHPAASEDARRAVHPPPHPYLRR